MSNNGDEPTIRNQVNEDLKHEDDEDRKILGSLLDDGGVIYNEKCPICGCEDRIFERFYNHLVRHNKVPAGKMAGSSRDDQLFTSPVNQLVGGTAPGITVIRDICASCYTEYPVRLIRANVVLGIEQGR